MKENVQKTEAVELPEKLKQMRIDMIEKPLFGNALSVLAGLLFMFVCMLLPLVGPAGVVMEFSDKNFTVFLTVLMLAALVSGAASAVNLLRRKREGGTLPYFPIGLFCISILTMLALGLGLLKV